MTPPHSTKYVPLLRSRLMSRSIVEVRQTSDRPHDPEKTVEHSYTFRSIKSEGKISSTSFFYRYRYSRESITAIFFTVALNGDDFLCTRSLLVARERHVATERFGHPISNSLSNYIVTWPGSGGMHSVCEMEEERVASSINHQGSSCVACVTGGQWVGHGASSIVLV